MTGSLQIKNGRYYAVVRIPSETGQEKQKWISTGVYTSGNNKRKATQRLREILVELEEQKIIYSPDILFLDWLDKWMEQKKHDVRLNTFESYEGYLNGHIKPHFKALKLMLRKISPQHIQDYFNCKRKAGLSAYSIQKHNVVICGALKEAVKKNLIPYNPADRATLPAKKKFVGKSYTLEQANKLLEVADGETIKPAIILGLLYGLRRSEVLGLRWQDIDFKTGTIQIRNTVVRTKTLIEHEETKSNASKRTLFIIPETREYFLKCREQQEVRRELLGSSYHESDHVCVWEDGRSFEPSYISRKFKKLLEASGLPLIRFHELRHTAGSLLLEKGLSPKQIQEYLGHEKIATTLDIYTHLSLDGRREAANVMGGALDIGSA